MMVSFPDKPVAQLLGSNGPIHAVTYSSSPGTYILTGSADRVVRLYNPSSSSTATSTATAAGVPSTNFITPTRSAAAPNPIPEGRLIQKYEGHGYEVLSVSVSQDNSRFVSSGGDRAVFLWDVSTAQTIRRFGGDGINGHGHTGGGRRVNAVCFAGQDDSVVVSGGLDATVRIWDTKSNNSHKPIQTLSDAKDSITSLVAVPPDEGGQGQIIVGSVDGRVRTYDIRMGRCTTDTLPAPVTSLCLGRDGQTVLVGTLDSKIRLMDRSTGGCLRTYGGGGNGGGEGEEGWVNKEIRVQSVLGGEDRFVVAGDENPPTATTTGGTTGGTTGVTTAGGGAEGRVWVWDVLTGKLVTKLSVPWGPSSSTTTTRKIVVGKDGKEVVKERKNVISSLAWRKGGKNGYGGSSSSGGSGSFVVGGTSGVATVFGAP
ncbi:putative mitogen-activated protein kinase [Diplogelasinospora grovesii]|uniref:Mitogen-activated protein kinase n=1 Tax=Diplogelasinospora grovesii TaxID=303347 RepID=A0AAN6S999_9PEZI|nr:putative mitogen-activated protein kinase [Diplogelasinospora grovesii]